jgi:hypothetical protein
MFEKSLIRIGPKKISLWDCELGFPIEFSLNSEGSYVSNTRSPEPDQIRLKNKIYHRYINGKPVQAFDLQGRLIRWAGSEGIFNLSYSSEGKIATVNLESGETIRWIWRQGKVVEIIGTKGVRSLFQYQDRNLVRVDHSYSVETEKYRYSETHNMIQNGKEAITYNDEKDIVTATQIGACTDSFSYEGETSVTRAIQSTSHKRQCGTKAPKRQQYRFVFRQRVYEGLALTQVEWIRNNRTQVYRLDENLGTVSSKNFERREFVGRQGSVHEEK